MASGAAENGTDLLPEGVRALNPDLQTGNILHFTGEFRGQLGMNGFEVKDGMVTVWPLSHPEQTHRANDYEVATIAEQLGKKYNQKEAGDQPAASVISEGPRGVKLLKVKFEKAGKEIPINRLTEDIGARLRAAVDAESTRQTAFSTHWQKKRQDLLKKNEGTSELLQNVATISSANVAASYLEEKAKTCGGSYDALKEVQKDLDAMLGILNEFSTYETELSSAAASEHFDLKTPALSALSLGDQKGREVLEDRLKTLREKISAEMNALTNSDAFLGKTRDDWEAENQRVGKAHGIDMEFLARQCLDETAVTRFLENESREARTVASDNSEAKAMIKEWDDCLKTLEAIDAFAKKMHGEAATRGVKFSGHDVEELKTYAPPSRAKMRTDLTKLRDQLNARVVFNDVLDRELTAAAKGNIPEDEALLDNIELNGDDPQLEQYVERLRELNGEVNEKTSGATLQAIGTEIADKIQPYLSHASGLSTQREGVYGNLIDQVNANVFDGEPINRELTERQNKHRARNEKIKPPLDMANAILQRIETLTGQRGKASEAFKIHQAARSKPVVERATEAFRGSRPVQYLENEIGQARRERMQREKNQQEVKGTCEVPLAGGFEKIEFRTDGLFHNVTDASGASTEEKITDPAVLAAIVTALNDRKVRTEGSGQEIFTRPRGHFHFILNPDTLAIIRENRGDPAVLDRDRIRGITNGVTPFGLLKPIKKEIGTVIDERLKKEHREQVIEGSCVLTMPTGSGPVHFKKDGIFIEVDDGAGNFTEEKMTDPDELKDVLEALNHGNVPADAPASFKRAARTSFRFNTEGAVVRVTEGNPATRDADRLAGIARAGWNGVNKAVNKQMAKTAFRNFVSERGLPEYVGSLTAAGKKPEEIVDELELLLGGDDPAQAEALQYGSYQQIYVEALRQQETLQKWNDRKEKVTEFASKRKRNLKLLLPFTKEKEWLKWMDEKKIVRSIRKQREDGEKDPAIRVGLETTYKDTEDLKQILDLAFERANDEAANKRLAAAFVKEKKMEEKVRKHLKDGKTDAEIRAALEAEHKATPNMSAAELKEIVDTAIERVEAEKRSAKRWETATKVLKAVTTAAGIGVAGLGVGAGLLGIAGVYGVTKVAQGVMRVGAEVGHQVGDKAPKLAKAILPTIGGIIKSPFTLIASPFVGAYRGLSAGWNYPAKPKVRPLKGWTAPFKGIANVFGWGWHKAKAAPSALAIGVLGLALGGLWQGPGDAVVHDILGVKTHMPVPAFMTGGGAHGGMPANASVGKVSATPEAANNANHFEEKPHAHAA